MKLTSYFAIFILFFVVGCASAPTQQPFIDKASGETEIGEQARAYVGDKVYSKFNIKKRYEGYVTGSFKISGVGQVNMADTRVERMLVDGQDGAAVRDNIMVQTTFYGPMPITGITFIDENSDGTFDKYGAPTKGVVKLKTPIFVEWEQSSRSKGFMRELIYQGRDGDNLKLFYREFNDDFRRPAYDQEVQYDLSESDYVQFKGLTIKVHEANNEFMIFEIEGGSL